MPVQLIKYEDAPWGERVGAPPGKCLVAEATCSENLASMSGGWAYFDECEIAWRVRYDEFIFVLSGEFVLGYDQDGESKEITALKGDVVFIPKDTLLKYKGRDCTVFYALAPANWKEVSNFVSFLDFE